MGYYLDKNSKTIILVAIIAVLIIIIVWTYLGIYVFKSKTDKPYVKFQNEGFKNSKGEDVNYGGFMGHNVHHNEDNLEEIFKEPFNPNEVQQSNQLSNSRKKQLAPRISGKESAMAYTMKSDIGSEREDIEVANDKNINMINHKKYIQDMFDHKLRSGNMYQ